ncbi:MAG: Ribonuclease VapC20 [Candidatus Scalindua rubra]|uniref:Ribonuclease VapC20 n=1 Tax=Candidatus Scalindua rubra TaxID=1872076 RepID=A0A1E3XEH9_9BACT|nr:MAG: Ribonuclease VapC20 [Candidatus Scalindua rubra]
MKVFIDTSAFCALAIPKDRHNIRAKSIYKQLKERRTMFYTSDYILDEVYTLLKTRGSYRTSIKFMDRIDKSHIIIHRVTEKVEEDTKSIFRRFEDKKLSFTDCTSFALINQLGIEAVFAFDKHFRYHSYSHPVKFLG